MQRVSQLPSTNNVFLLDQGTLPLLLASPAAPRPDRFSDTMFRLM